MQKSSQYCMFASFISLINENVFPRLCAPVHLPLQNPSKFLLQSKYAHYISEKKRNIKIYFVFNLTGKA